MFQGFSSNVRIPVNVSGNGIELSVLKKSEKEDCWIEGDGFYEQEL